MKKALYVFLGLVAVIAFLWILILFTGTLVLIKEVKVEPGDEYYVENYGNLGESQQASLVGYYFNGRGVLTKVYWYAPNNIFGRDSCPFLLRE